MVYLGRTCLVGLTQDGRHAMIYRVEGRSPESKGRIATIQNGTIHIGPLDGKDRDILRHYDAIITSNNGIGAVTNGYQTPDVFNDIYVGSIANESKLTASDRSRNPTIGMRQVLEKYGPETDSVKTPRIAGSIRLPQFLLGAISQYGVNVVSVSPTKGEFYGVSTYSGDPQNTANPNNLVIPYTMSVTSRSILGTTAQELANHLFEMEDKNLVVCTAAAVWNGNREKWDLATQNTNKPVL